MAFVRRLNVRSSTRQVHQYVKIVENVREQGKVKQRVIANLGNINLLSQDIKQIVNGLLRACGERQRVLAQDGRLVSVKEYGVR